MSKQGKYIAGIILGAAVGVALYKFFSMSEEERREWVDRVKETTHELLDNAEDTAEKVESYISEMNAKGRGEWIDKLYVVRKMLRNLYGGRADA